MKSNKHYLIIIFKINVQLIKSILETNPMAGKETENFWPNFVLLSNQIRIISRLKKKNSSNIE